MKKKDRTTILMHNGGRLGNQVWLIAAVYAYCLEKNTDFDIRCFFEYQGYFTIRSQSVIANIVAKIYYFLTITVHLPESIMRDIFYIFFNIWYDLFALFKKNKVIFEVDDTYTYSIKMLAYKIYASSRRVLNAILRSIVPTKRTPPATYGIKSTKNIHFLPPSKSLDGSMMAIPANTYLSGWLFRNPVGIIKYQDAIKAFLAPQQTIRTRVETLITNIQKTHLHIVGVHIRLGDVVNEFIDNDRVAFSSAEVYAILKEYVSFSGIAKEKICFVVCSDGEISSAAFSDLTLHISKGGAVEDMWLLSKTDIIIGADSSFAISASYLGNIPFIVFKRGSIDWAYYRGKNTYFENKYVQRFIY